MNIYLSDKNIGGSIYSILKSGGMVTSFYTAASCTILHFYIKTGFPNKSLLPNYRSLPHIFSLDLLSGISLTLLITILST